MTKRSKALCNKAYLVPTLPVFMAILAVMLSTTVANAQRAPEDLLNQNTYTEESYSIETYNFAETGGNAYFMLQVKNPRYEHFQLEFDMSHSIISMLPASEIMPGSKDEAAWELIKDGGVLVAEEVLPPVLSAAEIMDEFFEELDRRRDVEADNFELRNIPQGDSVMYFVWTSGDDPLNVWYSAEYARSGEETISRSRGTVPMSADRKIR